MPRDQETERVLVVRVDHDGNVLNYETADQPVQSHVAVKSSSVQYTQPQRVKRNAVYEKENYKDDKYVQQHRSVVAVPSRDRHQESYIETTPRRRRLRYAPQKSTVKIFDEKSHWHGSPKIDSHNERSIGQLHNSRRPVHIPQEQRSKADRLYIDNQYYQHDDYRRQERPRRLPPTQQRKFAWQRQSHADERDNGSIERIREQRSMSPASRKKYQWRYTKSKTDHYNENFVEQLHDQRKPGIVNHLPRWRSEPKIKSYNDFYDPRNSRTKPRIFNEKLRWHARPKIDTGFEPDPYDD